MQKENSDISGREQITSLLLDAPVELVWEVWTKPEHIKHWWGPNGFTNTITKMEVVTNGDWIFTMHGPDGKDYPNRTIFREVLRHKKLFMRILIQILLPQLNLKTRAIKHF